MKMKTGKKETKKTDIKMEVAGFKPESPEPYLKCSRSPQDLHSGRIGAFLAYELLEEMIGEFLPDDAEEVKAKDVVPKALKELEKDESVNLNAVIEALVIELNWSRRSNSLKSIVDELLGEIDKFKPVNI